jgi:archaellum component FlaF (FlaF/FlaG flagellin family)
VFRARRILTYALLFGSSVLAVTSSAQLETRSTTPISGEPLAIAVGDFNHDGKLDAAVTSYSANRIGVLLGNGDGTFQPPTYYAVDSPPASIAVADFNHDGNLDLAVADFNGKNISVLLGNEDGTFGSPTPFSTTALPNDISVGDFNNDGNPDLVVCDSPYVSVLLGNGDGTFKAPVDTDVSFCSQASGSVLVAGDFNRDGKLDVAVVSNELDILLGNGDGTFQLAGDYSAGVFCNTVAMGEFNGDQRLDLAVTNVSGSQIYVFLGNGDGTFQSEAPLYADLPSAIQVADLNGDGKADLVFVSETQLIPSNVLAVMPGNGDGTFQPATNYQKFKEGAMLVVGDFNGDHKPDVAVADYLGQAVDVLLNTGVVSFSPTTPVTFAPQLVGTTSGAQNVTLTNNGGTVLTISTMRIRGPFQLAGGTTCATSVAPGASCTLSFVFQPITIGSSAGQLSISDSASTKPQVIELKGNGTVINLSPTQLNFGPQKVGTKSAVHNVTVTNTGSAAVNVASVFITGTAHRDYAETNTCRSQIDPGASCTISVTFTPTQTGTRTALVGIIDNGGGSPQDAHLTGTGTSAQEILSPQNDI